jgi:hypothetical protein
LSPYPWLASHQLDELRVSAGAKFCFVPVLFAALLDYHSTWDLLKFPRSVAIRFWIRIVGPSI